MPLHARTRSVDAWHRSGHWMTTRRRDRVRVWPSEAARRPMQSSHIVDILRTGAAVVFVEVFYLGVVEGRWVAHIYCCGSSAASRRLPCVELPVNHREVTCMARH